MSNELDQYLAAAGFGKRRAQTALYKHLTSLHEDGAMREHGGVVAQAGTGTGKSAAILSAAAHHARHTGQQALVVTPTLTLMNQYRDGDLPVAMRAFTDLSFAELRGRAHYHCDVARDSAEMLGLTYTGGCEGTDGGCTAGSWSEDGTRELENPVYRCDYQMAKARAHFAEVIVTNSDMLIVNDRILAQFGGQIFDLEGSLFVDEAHTLEQKLRDWASRSLWWKSIERFNFAGRAAPNLAAWLKERAPDGVTLRSKFDVPYDDLWAIANSNIPDPRPKDGLAKQRETKEACARIVNYLDDVHDNAVLHVHDGSLKMDWINIATSAGELLSARYYGLVSATVPRTMAACLGVQQAPFIDVGHPFTYSEQAWLGFSPYGGGYKEAQHESNLLQRVSEVEDLIRRSKGGALILFSSFRDLEEVSERLRPTIMRDLGLTFLRQERDMEASDRQALAETFKADGNAVLFGSESFATGFDVPGDALRLVVLWKLPYPAVDPVSNAIRSNSYPRYEDLMKVRAVQAIGRLIRRETDRGIVWVADSRGRRLLDSSDPLTSHLPQFARL